jgi:hypothetical protein
MTAVEWLFLQLYERFEMKGDGREMDKVLEQAKAMEERQIINAYSQGYMIGEESNVITPSLIMAEQYYNQTYNK